MTLSKAAVRATAIDIERLAEVVREWTEKNPDDTNDEAGSIIEECERIEASADYIRRMLEDDTERKGKNDE